MMVTNQQMIDFLNDSDATAVRNLSKCKEGDWSIPMVINHLFGHTIAYNYNDRFWICRIVEVSVQEMISILNVMPVGEVLVEQRACHLHLVGLLNSLFDEPRIAYVYGLGFVDLEEWTPDDSRYVVS